METIQHSKIEILDKAALISRLCDDEDLANEVLSVFIEDTPHQIESLKAAQKEGDSEMIARQGHTIKGASSNVSAMRMRQIATEIELAGKQGTLEKLPGLLAELEDQFKKLQNYISR